MLTDNVLLKEISRAWYFRHIVFQKLGPRENLKIFQCFAGFFVVVVVVRFFFCFFFFRSFFFCFLFLCHVESRLSPV